MSEQNTNPPATNPPAPQDEKKEKGKKARVLSVCEIGGNAYKPNDVAVFDDATIKAHAADLDASPAAVKYAESLGKESES